MRLAWGSGNILLGRSVLVVHLYLAKDPASKDHVLHNHHTVGGVMEFLDLIQHVVVFLVGSVENLVIFINPEGDDQGVPLLFELLDEGVATNEINDPVASHQGAATVKVLVVQIVQCFVVDFSDIVVVFLLEEVDGGLGMEERTMLSCKAAKAESRLAKVGEQEGRKTAVIRRMFSYLLMDRQQLAIRPSQIGVGILGIQGVGDSILLEEERILNQGLERLIVKAIHIAIVHIIYGDESSFRNGERRTQIRGIRVFCVSLPHTKAANPLA